MCHITCISFGATNLSERHVTGKRIIEVGSYDVNGSLRPIIEAWNPADYVGVDIQKGPGVDVVCRAEDLVETFGKESFDIVISTELLEHVRDWRKVISDIKNVCRPNGIILITTRSYGFKYHAHPYDFWRYELSDMEYIFCDCIMEKLEKDKFVPGVFVKARKLSNFVEKDLSHYELYSILVDKRVREIDEKSIREFERRWRRREFVRVVRKKFKKLMSGVGRAR